MIDRETHLRMTVLPTITTMKPLRRGNEQEGEGIVYFIIGGVRLAPHFLEWSHKLIKLKLATQ